MRPDRVCLRGATEESVLEYSAPLGVLAPKSFAKSLKTAQLLLFKCGRLARVFRMYIGAFSSSWAVFVPLIASSAYRFSRLWAGLISHSSHPSWPRHASCIGLTECRP